MNLYTMHCPTCHQSFVVGGVEEEEDDTNAFIPDEGDMAEHQEALGCDHDKAYITDVEYDDPWDCDSPEGL